MAKLILIKHALPKIEPTIPSWEWPLSDQGRSDCGILASCLRGYNPAVLICSMEPKAQETARLVAALLGKPQQAAEGLQENDRQGFPHLPTTEWKEAFRRFFAHPNQCVIGRETAEAARKRFTESLQIVLREQTDGDVAVVSHGTVITLFVAFANNQEAFPLWERLKCPSFIVLDRYTLQVEKVVDDVNGCEAEGERL